MFLQLYSVLFIVLLQQNVLGIRQACNFCHDLQTYNYVITIATMPYTFLNGCSLRMGGESCSIVIEIDLDKQESTLNVSLSKEYVESSVKIIESIENGLKHKRSISLWCSDRYGGCNSVNYLKRVLESLTIEGSFKELEPLLIPTNQTITNTSCLVYSNTTTTTECQSTCNDNNDAKACYIESLSNTEKSFDVCAHCSSMDDYYLIHSMTYYTDNLTISQSDNRILSCALPECNTVENLERINQLVKIDFDMKNFSDTSTTTIFSPTTTGINASDSLFWINNFNKYYIVFIHLMVAFIYNI